MRHASLFPLLGLLTALSGQAMAGESDLYANDDCDSGLVYVLDDGVVAAVPTGS